MVIFGINLFLFHLPFGLTTPILNYFPQYFNMRLIRSNTHNGFNQLNGFRSIPLRAFGMEILLNASVSNPTALNT